METQRLFEWFDAIRSQTETQYQQLLERMRCELKVDKVEPWDLEFYFSTRTNDFEEKRFVPDQGWTKTEQLARSLGYDLNKLPVQMLTADLSFAGAAYPILYGREVKILANRYSGIFFFDRLFHAAGHALHYSMMNESSFLLRANYAEPFDEGLAQVMALMLYRPEVNGELFDLTPEESEIARKRTDSKKCSISEVPWRTLSSSLKLTRSLTRILRLSTIVSIPSTSESTCMARPYGPITLCMGPTRSFCKVTL